MKYGCILLSQNNNSVFKRENIVLRKLMAIITYVQLLTSLETLHHWRYLFSGGKNFDLEKKKGWCANLTVLLLLYPHRSGTVCRGFQLLPVVTTDGKNQKKTGRKVKNLNSSFRAQTSDYFLSEVSKNAWRNLPSKFSSHLFVTRINFHSKRHFRKGADTLQTLQAIYLHNTWIICACTLPNSKACASTCRGLGLDIV